MHCNRSRVRWKRTEIGTHGTCLLNKIFLNSCLAVPRPTLGHLWEKKVSPTRCYSFSCLFVDPKIIKNFETRLNPLVSTEWENVSFKPIAFPSWVQCLIPLLEPLFPCFMYPMCLHLLNVLQTLPTLCVFLVPPYFSIWKHIKTYSILTILDSPRKNIVEIFQSLFIWICIWKYTWINTHVWWSR